MLYQNTKVWENNWSSQFHEYAVIYFVQIKKCGAKLKINYQLDNPFEKILMNK